MTAARAEPPVVLEQIAAEAADIVGITRVMKRLSDKLFDQIEECERFAEAAEPLDANAIFIALSLPIANSLIHYATSEERLNRAQLWLRENWPNQQSDPISALASLVLMYVVSEGWKQFRKDAARKAIWSRIRRRVARPVQK
jgi:hypothetical protein